MTLTKCQCDSDATTCQTKIPILLPAYQPGRALVELVEALAKFGCHDTVVVNDGSSPEHSGVFEEVESLGAVVLHHAVNLGKGAALKTGLNYVLLTWPDAPGTVTADADGQHAPEDIAAISRKLYEHPNALVLGVRRFDEDVPARSLIGN